MSDDAAPVARALVVDDDPDINRLVQVRLGTRGYQVEAASNGEEALNRLSQSPPDLMFLDVSMPGVGGLEVLEQIRAQALDLAVIMMTAFGSEEVAIEALRRGADDYLRKPFGRDEFEAVLTRTVTRLELSRQNAALRRQLEAEFARAGQVQADLLPLEAPALPGFELAARCIPAREVGGDFYDWQQVAPGVLSLTLGDVMGKGMPAALLMATIRAALRSVARQSAPARAVQLASAALEQDLARSGSFVTLFHAHLDTAARRLDYVDAGHGHVFIRHADGRVEELPARGLPLGVLPEEQYEEGSLTLEPGDTVVLYSDGVVDAHPSHELSATMLAEQLGGTGSALAMVERLVALVPVNGPLPDDLTVLVLHCLGAS